VSEYQEQVALMQEVAARTGQYPELALLFAVPNGEARSEITGAKLKRMGAKAGVPDLFLPVPRGGYAGLWIEMKYGKNKPTREQTWWLEQLRAQGYRVAVCWTSLDAWLVIEGYLHAQKEQAA
jgi:hypothetical protein